MILPGIYLEARPRNYPEFPSSGAFLSGPGYKSAGLCGLKTNYLNMTGSFDWFLVGGSGSAFLGEKVCHIDHYSTFLSDSQKYHVLDSPGFSHSTSASYLNYFAQTQTSWKNPENSAQDFAQMYLPLHHSYGWARLTATGVYCRARAK